MSTDTHIYIVPDMSCAHCEQAIEGRVRPVEGVTSVTVDLAAKTVTVVGGDSATIEAAIAEAGYPVAGHLNS